jgi:hypothetical protein
MFESQITFFIIARTSNFTLHNGAAYLHPEKDQRLVTENYLVRLNRDLVMTDCTKVEMLDLASTYLGVCRARRCSAIHVGKHILSLRSPARYYD